MELQHLCLTPRQAPGFLQAPSKRKERGLLDSYHFMRRSLAQGWRKVPECRLLCGYLLVPAPKHGTLRARTVTSMLRAGPLPEGQVNHGQGSPCLHCPLRRAQDAGPQHLNCRMSRVPPRERRKQSKFSQADRQSSQRPGHRGASPSLLSFLGCLDLPVRKKIGLWAKTRQIGAAQIL